VLRFWETRFPQIKPLKRGGGRRYYRPEDVQLLKAIKERLYGEGYTIKGVQRFIREHGLAALTGGANETGASFGLSTASRLDLAPASQAGASLPARLAEALRAALDELREAQRVLEQAGKR